MYRSADQRSGLRWAHLGRLSGILWVIFGASPVFAQTLDDAYRTELTRLEAEKASIRAALEQSKSRAEADRAGLVKEIEGLSKTLTRLRADNNNREQQLPQLGRSQSIEAQERNVDRRAKQIETWLETHGVVLPSVEAEGDKAQRVHKHPPLDLMVEAALGHVEEHGQLWLRREQEYFDENGMAKTGPVLHIAEVGAVAIGPALRPLELAMDGSLRLQPGVNLPAVSHGDTRTISAVLFDPDDIRPSRAEASTWRDWMNRGGVVMWVIGALAVIAILLFIERLLTFALFVIRVASAERQGPSVAVPKQQRLLKAVHVIQTEQGTPDELETRAAEAILQTQPYVRRGVSLLAVVASVAPLLGLLGTVTGMIATFGMITEHGTGDPRLLSGGISEALLTTQFGLMVAIPALIFQTILYRGGDAILRRVERLALDALELRTDRPTNIDSESKATDAVETV